MQFSPMLWLYILSKQKDLTFNLTIKSSIKFLNQKDLGKKMYFKSTLDGLKESLEAL